MTFTDLINCACGSLTQVLCKVQNAKLRLQLAKVRELSPYCALSFQGAEIVVFEQTLSAAGRYDEAVENLHISISLSPKDSGEATQVTQCTEAFSLCHIL